MILEIKNRLLKSADDKLEFDKHIFEGLSLLKVLNINQRLLDLLSISENEFSQYQIQSDLVSFLMEDVRRGYYSSMSYEDHLRLSYLLEIIDQLYSKDFYLSTQQSTTELREVKIYLEVVRTAQSIINSDAYVIEYCLNRALELAKRMYDFYNRFDLSSINFSDNLFDVLTQIVRHRYFGILESFFNDIEDRSSPEWRCYTLLFLLGKLDKCDETSFDILLNLISQEINNKKYFYCDLDQIKLKLSTVFSSFGYTDAAELEFDFIFDQNALILRKGFAFKGDSYDLSADDLSIAFLREMIIQRRSNEVQSIIVLRLSELDALRQDANEQHKVGTDAKWCSIKSDCDEGFFFFFMLAKVLSISDGKQYPFLKNFLRYYENYGFEENQVCICKSVIVSCKCLTCGFCQARNHVMRFFEISGNYNYAAHFIHVFGSKYVPSWILINSIKMCDIDSFRLVVNLEDVSVKEEILSRSWISLGSVFSRYNSVNSFVSFLEAINHPICRCSFFIGFVLDLKAIDFSKEDFLSLLTALPNENLILVLLEKFEISRWIRQECDLFDYDRAILRNWTLLHKLREEFKDAS